jgi:MFS family permease
LGIMYAMPGLGTLLGGFALAAYGDIERKGTFMSATALLTAAGVFGFVMSSSLWLILPLLVLVGIGTTTFNATVTTVLQMRSPPDMRGRVMGYNTIAWRGLTTLGGSVVGVGAEAFGTREAIAGGGIIVMVSVLALYLLVPFVRQADRTTAPEKVPAAMA